MKPRMPIVASLMSLTMLSATEAAQDRYSCTIERGYSLEASGLKGNRRLINALETRSFEIDRQTGLITGSELQNLQYDPIVVAPGTSENSFQAYWIVRSITGTRVRFIEVQEFAEGPAKPFRAIVQNWTYTGSCE